MERISDEKLLKLIEHEIAWYKVHKLDHRIGENYFIPVSRELLESRQTIQTMTQELLELRDRIDMGEAILADAQKRLAAAEKVVEVANEMVHGCYPHIPSVDEDGHSRLFEALEAYDKLIKE